MTYKPAPADFAVLSIGNFEKINAQKYYRILAPSDAMYRLGLANVFRADQANQDELPNLMCGSDIVQVWGAIDEGTLATAKAWQEAKPIKRGNKYLTPAVFVMDMDDAIEHVYPFNEVFAVYGIRDWDGSFLEPGDKVQKELNDGSYMTIWEDKKTKGVEGKTFDIERNIETITRHYDIAKAAGGITVSTPALKELFEYQGCENVYVYPNSVVPEDHYFPTLAPHEGVRIFWEGGASHMESWWPIRHAFVNFMKTHPQCKFVAFGQHFAWMDEIPKAQFEHHGWVHYEAYKIHRACMDADINLCPLFDHPFTRAKSAIRFYEASLGPKPEATLAANVGPYKEIQHGKTGLLYSTPEEFVEQLEGLVQNADLRKDLGAGAKDWVLANRTVNATVPGLISFYKELKAKQRQEALAV